MDRQLSKLEQSPATTPKTCAQYHGPNMTSQLRTTNQQVHWVVQVIKPYVSKGRSHGDCWCEASYGHLVNLSQADIKWLWSFRIIIIINKQKIKIEILM